MDSNNDSTLDPHREYLRGFMDFFSFRLLIDFLHRDKYSHMTNDEAEVKKN